MNSGKGAPEGFLRPRMARIIALAARQGFPDADRLWHMGLSEAARALEARAAERRAQAGRDEREKLSKEPGIRRALC